MKWLLALPVLVYLFTGSEGWKIIKRGLKQAWQELKQPPPDAKAMEEKKRLDSLYWRKRD